MEVPEPVVPDDVVDSGLVEDFELVTYNEVVLGLVEEETLQIIIGPGKVNKVTEEFGKLIDEFGGINLENRAAQRKSELKEKNATPFKLLLRRIASIFIPLIPALVASGLITGVTKPTFCLQFKFHLIN